MSRCDDLVQICLPTHNGEAHLAIALDSLLNQTHRNIEIVIMDNASTDGTGPIARAYAERDGRIRYFRSEEFVSASENWNRAFEKIDPGRSEFFMWASDDDLWSPNYIEKLLPSLLSDRRRVLCFCNYRTLDLSGQIIEDRKFPPMQWEGVSALRTFRWLMGRGGGHCAIYGIGRVSALSWKPLLDTTSFGADLWFLLQLAARGKFFYVDAVLFSKRAGGVSVNSEDPSIVTDVPLIWNIGRREWELIGRLPTSFVARLYLFLRLKVTAKLLFPDHKSINPYLWPWFLAELLRWDPYALGLRSRLWKILALNQSR